MHELTLQPNQCPIHSVTVYLRGAQIQRKGRVALAEGETRLTLGRLPVGLLPESIQAALGDEAGILSVEHRTDYMAEPAWDETIRQMRDKLDELLFDRARKQALCEVCEAQEEMLDANRGMAGAHTGLKASDLREGAAFFRECMEDIKSRRLELDRDLEELERQIDSLENQLGGLSRKSSFPVSEIVLRLSSERATEVSLDLSYFVDNAGWTPSYDVRARDAQSPIRLSCKAKIAQSTGEEWEGVALTVSTGSPSSSAVCPELTPWRLDFERPNLRSGSGMYQSFNAAKVRISAEMMEYGHIDEDLAPVPSAAAMPEPEPVGAQIDRSLTTVEYRIPTPCTVLSGQGEQIVEMVAHQVPARYLYRGVRKLDKEVYLIARVQDYARLNLVAGEANIFFENKYVGKSFIDPRQGEDEIDWSLGSDQSVVVTRHKGKSFTAGALGGGRKVTREWELTARNLKDRAITIQLQDQVPVSANKQIQVETVEISGAEMDKDTGLLKWEFELAPSEARTLSIRYVVIHPKNTIVLLD